MPYASVLYTLQTEGKSKHYIVGIIFYVLQGNKFNRIPNTWLGWSDIPVKISAPPYPACQNFAFAMEVAIWVWLGIYLRFTFFVPGSEIFGQSLSEQANQCLITTLEAPIIHTKILFLFRLLDLAVCTIKEVSCYALVWKGRDAGR